MIGAIAGDIIGSAYEAAPIKSKDYPLFHRRASFTDDSVLTVAVAHAILEQTPDLISVREIDRRYPRAGYGIVPKEVEAQVMQRIASRYDSSTRAF